LETEERGSAGRPAPSSPRTAMPVGVWQGAVPAVRPPFYVSAALPSRRAAIRWRPTNTPWQPRPAVPCSEPPFSASVSRASSPGLWPLSAPSTGVSGCCAPRAQPYLTGGRNHPPSKTSTTPDSGLGKAHKPYAPHCTQVSFILPPLEMLTSLLPGAATLVMAPGTTSIVWASGARAWMR
jgi:hypothetical protein